MREEIAKWYFGVGSWDGMDPRVKTWCYRRADELLGMIRAKIEAVGNPYIGWPSAPEVQGFEDCRRDMLCLFSEGKET